MYPYIFIFFRKKLKVLSLKLLFHPVFLYETKSLAKHVCKKKTEVSSRDRRFSLRCRAIERIEWRESTDAHRLSCRETLVWLRGCYNFQGCFRWHSTTRVAPFTWTRTGASLFRRETSVSRLYSTRGKKKLHSRSTIGGHWRAREERKRFWLERKEARNTMLFFCSAGTLLTAIASWATLSCSSMQFEVNGGKSSRRWRRFVKKKRM